MSWPRIKLSEVAQINPRLPKYIDERQEVTFLPMVAVSESGLLLDQEKRILADTKKGFTYFEKNDVIIAKITPCFENGKAAFLSELETEIGFGSTEFHVIRADTDKLDPNYLFYLIWNKQLRHIGEENMTGSAGQKRVPTDFFKSLEIPLPPLVEQKRIAVILAKANSIQRKRQQAIKLADDFLRSVFLEMFGDPLSNPKRWKIEALKKHIEHANNGLSRRRKTEENIGEIVLRLQDVHYEGIMYEKELNRIELEEKEKTKFSLVNGDILFIRVNGNPEYVGRSAVFDGYSEAVYHNDHLIRIKVRKTYNPKFLSYTFNSTGGKAIILSKTKTSAGQHTISQSGIELLEIYIPPISLQDDFVKIKSKVDVYLLKAFRSKDSKSKCFHSLCQKALSGDL
jgi:type I restriction enzyme S subunit